MKSKQETQLRLREKTRGVTHCGLAIYIEKHLMANEELWKLQYFMKNYGNSNISPCKNNIIFKKQIKIL
jgi:hypothetical protein